MTGPARPPVRPLDPPMLPFALAGTGVWAAVGVILMITGAPAGARWTALAGMLIGAGLVAVMIGYDRRRARRAEEAGHR